MSSSKQPKLDEQTNPLQNDLERDPGIGQTKGAWATGVDVERIDGENTVVGDVGNDATPEGGVDPDQLGRENK